MADDTRAKLAAGLAKIGQVIRHEAWRGAGVSGLTPTQAQVLVAVDASSEGWMAVGEIARVLGVAQPTVSDAVAALERKGMVARERLESDRRVVCVRLTERGARLARAEANGPEVLLRAIEELDEAERDVFVKGLMKMIRSLQSAGRVPTMRMCASCVYFRPHAHPGTSKPHHCAYMDAPMRDSDLRFACAEQEPVPAGKAAHLWQIFVGGKPLDASSDLRDGQRDASPSRSGISGSTSRRYST